MKSINFLIIEDSAVDFIICKNIIQNHFQTNANIFTVKSLGAGISEVNRDDKNYDIVLLDLNLGDSRGLTTLQIFSDKCEAPIIVYSGLSDKNTIRQASQHGAAGYIVKGDSSETFIENINNVISNYSLTHPKAEKMAG